ncbi:MAG: heavy-metal-associated domain-containing protein [Bacteroidales bacterium]
MKTIHVMLAALFVLFSAGLLQAETNKQTNLISAEMISETGEKASFKVYGNCGMCENRIEKAAKGLEGVTSASWDRDSEMLTIKYNPEKVKVMDVHKAIAKVGHDTKKVKADDQTYKNLPGCCKYRD